ncbi:MAG: uracil-DNA glycosylase family protein [Cyclobacteriaceae bacterium]
MDSLLKEIRACSICSEFLPHGPNPIVAGNARSRILIIGQAPGRRVHESSVPWDDPSGNHLRQWLGIDKNTFYDPDKIALVPMGFCYPGTGKSGDLPPRPECAEAWHEKLIGSLQGVVLTLLIGQYAQRYYLKKRAKSNLTETVRAWKDYMPDFLPLPHPSPRNRIWMKKNEWFSEDVLPTLRTAVRDHLH